MRKEKAKKEKEKLVSDFLIAAEKYLPLAEFAGDKHYAIFIAQSPAELIKEGNALSHCVGRSGYDLNVSIIGEEDTLSISDYFYGDKYKVEEFQTTDGSLLDSTKIDLMIQAMASFEESTGMMWQDAVQNNNEQANDMINQWWVKE